MPWEANLKNHVKQKSIPNEISTKVRMFTLPLVTEHCFGDSDPCNRKKFLKSIHEKVTKL